jgi:glutamate/tyrosine decarboxylase-like PLP-dependent enzyme
LIERCCELARLAAEGLKAIPGVEVLNEVVLNQVLFRFAEDERTNAALAEVQRAGAVWLSGTKVDGRAAIRLSVSNWQSNSEDVERLIDAFAL